MASTPFEGVGSLAARKADNKKPAHGGLFVQNLLLTYQDGRIVELLCMPNLKSGCRTDG